MWGIVLGVVALGLAAYELLTRDGAKAGANALSAAAGGDAAKRAQAERERAAEAARKAAAVLAAEKCGLRSSDIPMTQEWVRIRFSRFVDLRTALLLMPSYYPREAWPDYALRTACYLERAES